MPGLLKITKSLYCLINVLVYRSSKSLLANVLDIDDDFRHNIRPISPSGGTLPHNNAFYRTVYGYVNNYLPKEGCKQINTQIIR